MTMTVPRAAVGAGIGSDTAIEIIELHPSEIQLIKVLRNSLKYGEVTVKMRDGLPCRLVRVQEFVDLA